MSAICSDTLKRQKSHLHQSIEMGCNLQHLGQLFIAFLLIGTCCDWVRALRHNLSTVFSNWKQNSKIPDTVPLVLFYPEIKGIINGVCQSSNLGCCCSAFFTDHSGEFDIAIRIYRGIFLFVLVTFLLAVNTWGWRKAGVNHVLIFELDPRDHLSYQQLLEVEFQSH